MLDPLTLDHLRVLAAVADAGSFSAAAKKLNRVQSAVSQSVQALEATLRFPLFDRTGRKPELTDAGKAMLGEARRLLHGVDMLKARAESIAASVEPELTLAIDAIFPNAVVMDSLKALRGVFPNLPVTLYTEGLGGAEQLLRDGAARLALYSPAVTGAKGLESTFFAEIPMVPVVAAHHPLAALRGPLSRAALENEVQLVLTDRTTLSTALSGGIVSRNIWRFADLSVRLEYLLAGFGWCNMPWHMVHGHIAAGRLQRLHLQERNAWSIHIHVVHEPGRPPGQAGRWLLQDLRNRLPTCAPELRSPAAHPAERKTRKKGKR